MGKTIKKVILCGSLILLSLCAAIPLSTWLHLLLTGEYSSREQLGVAACLESIAGDKQHQQIYLVLLLLFLMLVLVFWMMERGKETFESETVQVTPDIRTPVAVGQGQHGTARWQTPKESRKLFATLEIDPAAEPICSLLKQAAQEQRELPGREDCCESTGDKNQ